MKNIIHIISVVFIFISFGCEKIIDVDIDEPEVQVSIEAILTDQPFFSYVIVSKSAPLFEAGDVEFVDSAIVEVTDQNGTVYVFQQFTSGIYSNVNFIALQGETYSLRVVTGGNTFTSTVSTPQKVNFDETYIDYDYTTPFDDVEPRVHYTFTDSPVENTRYRIIAYKNGEKVNDGYTLYSDDNNNGAERDGNVYQFDFELGDTIFVDLLSVNDAYYEYFRVQSALSGGGLGSTPGNPPSNIESSVKALGYFGVLTVDRDTLYVTQ